MKYVVCFIALAHASFFIGCGSSTSVDGVVPTSGTVTYQGTPVEGASVTFSPEMSGRACSGLTDESGRFEMTTLQPGDGAMPGKYTVLISKTEVVGVLSDEEALAAMQAGKERTVSHKDLLPVKYKSAASSDLSAEVAAGGNNEFEFDLAD